MTPISYRIFKSMRVNSSRVHLENFVLRAAESVSKSSLVLDAGAGTCLYQKCFAGMNYESADFGQMDKGYGQLTYICDLTAIPVEDARYDLVLLTQVLEHLPEPLTALKELNRVLKPGCRLWLTQPFFYEEHEQPYDFFRYTQFGLDHLLKNSGFKIHEMFWLEGYYGTVAYQFELAGKYLPAQPKFYGGGLVGVLAAASSYLLRPAFTLLSLLFSRLDLRHKYTLTGHCKNYCVVAEKV